MPELFAIKYSCLIPLLPLAGAAIAGLLGSRMLKGRSHWPIWLGVGASAILSLVLLAGMVQRFGRGEPITPGEPDRKDAQGRLLPPQPPPSPYVHLNRDMRRVAASQDWYTWIRAGNFEAAAGFWIDPLTAVMLCVVTVVGFLITVYSSSYMAGDRGYFRFFAYMGLFIFSMVILVMANNFVLLYLGWEGVGLCSYLLIGYYYERPAARDAAIKAFLVNRIGDFGFALGIMLIFVVFGTVSFYGSIAQPGALSLAAASQRAGGFLSTLPSWKQHLAPVIPFLLMMGALGKSAQFPLYVWLPDAMEGPTPVSALIHAATMVTAGAYMIARCSTIFMLSNLALMTIAAIGAFTAIFAAAIALRQFDLKRILAYSTISQLGYMFVGVAVLAPVGAIFHLVTHAFFKALLFLSAGVVMHAMAGELDLRKMSGLKRVLPWTRWLMLIGCLALAGVIPFSGFWSKDQIIIGAFEHEAVLGAVLLITSLLTAYYTFRLYFRVFEGPELVPAVPAPERPHEHPDVDEHIAHQPPAHEEHEGRSHEPLGMTLPLVLLAIGAAGAGILALDHALGNFLGRSPSFRQAFLAASGASQAVDPIALGQPARDYVAPLWHYYMMFISIMVALLGIAVAYLLHLKERARADALARRYPLWVRILDRKFWVDEVYQAGIVEPLRRLGRGLFWIDDKVVDGIVWLVGFTPWFFGFGLRLTTQRGSLQGYALTMLGGIAIILLVVLLVS